VSRGTSDTLRQAVKDLFGFQWQVDAIVDPSQNPGAQVSPGVQVLTPTRRGLTGTVELGRRLQERLNPADPDKIEHWAGTSVFRIGDKVMPVRNDPNKGSSGIFNGTTAVVSDLDPQSRTMQLRTDDGDIAVYDFDELDDLLHAYAISVHRSQGSEYPYVVAPLTTETGPLMLYRNLLYTLVTRARRLVVLVGQRRALEIAVHNAGRDRNTALARRLQTLLDGGPARFGPGGDS
jgi:exodeoxyribonuclease V alpha subunit